MRTTSALGILLLCTVAAAGPASAQAAAKPTAEQQRARYEAHKGDFDYLLGDWEFSATQHPPGGVQSFGGRWSAVRLGEGAEVLDEFRVLGDSGQTWHLSHTLRSYNSRLDRWELITTDEGQGLQNFGTAHKVGAEMHIEQTFQAMSDRPALWRIRYYAIAPDHFSWTADRSLDKGKTWTSPFMTIDARRIGPSHDMSSLTPAP